MCFTTMIVEKSRQWNEHGNLCKGWWLKINRAKTDPSRCSVWRMSNTWNKAKYQPQYEHRIQIFMHTTPHLMSSGMRRHKRSPPNAMPWRIRYLNSAPMTRISNGTGRTPWAYHWWLEGWQWVIASDQYVCSCGFQFLDGIFVATPFLECKLSVKAHAGDNSTGWGQSS